MFSHVLRDKRRNDSSAESVVLGEIVTADKSDQFKDLAHWSATCLLIHLPSARLSAREWRGDAARSRRCASQKGLRDWTHIFYLSSFRRAHDVVDDTQWIPRACCLCRGNLSSSHKALRRGNPVPSVDECRRRRTDDDEGLLVGNCAREANLLVLENHPSNFA